MHFNLHFIIQVIVNYANDSGGILKNLLCKTGGRGGEVGGCFNV